MEHEPLGAEITTAAAGAGLVIALEIDATPEAWGEDADEEIAGEAALVLGELLGELVRERWPRAELTSRTVRVTSGASHRIADVRRADGAAGTFAEQEAREEIAAEIAAWSEDLWEAALERALGGEGAEA